MARFDVHRGRAPDARGALLLDVQADLLAALRTRVVLPLLRPSDVPRPVRDLNPVLRLGGEDWMVVPQGLATVPRSALGPVVGSLAHEGVAITRALDTLLTGF